MRFPKYLNNILLKVTNQAVGGRLIPSNLKNLGSLGNAWRDKGLPQSQRIIVDKELREYRKTKKAPPHHQALFDLLKSLSPKNKTLLEIGCSSGYFSEFFKLAKIPVKYSGCDYSESFIQLAKEKYPTIKFTITDARDLNFKNKEFDIVLLSGIVSLVKEWETVTTEGVRVSSKYIILHRIPVVHVSPTKYFEEYGYGVKMFEIVLNESELVSLLRKLKLKIIDIKSFSPFPRPGINEPVVQKSYLLERFT